MGVCAAERLPLHCTQMIHCQYYKCTFHPAVNIVMYLIKRISERRPTNKGKHVFCRSTITSTICPIKCLMGASNAQKRNLSSVFSEDRRDVDGGFGLSRSDILKSITGQEGRLRGQERGTWPSGVIQCVQEKEFIQWVKKPGVHLPFQLQRNLQQTVVYFLFISTRQICCKAAGRSKRVWANKNGSRTKPLTAKWTESKVKVLTQSQMLSCYSYERLRKSKNVRLISENVLTFSS